MCCNIWYQSQACLLRLHKTDSCFHWNTAKSQAASNLQGPLMGEMPPQILCSPLAQPDSHSKGSWQNVDQICTTLSCPCCYCDRERQPECPAPVLPASCWEQEQSWTAVYLLLVVSVLRHFSFQLYNTERK